MREASKFARSSDMKEKIIKEEEARLREEQARGNMQKEEL